MNFYGPVFFDRSNDPNHIPAIDWPDERRQRIDPNRREQVALTADKPQLWASDKPRWTFNVSTGELESRSWIEEVEAKEINAVLDEATKKYSKNAVRRIVLYLSPYAVERHFHELRIRGFERCVAKERGDIPQLVYVGPAKQWK
jgi:hypothetical protein